MGYCQYWTIDPDTDDNRYQETKKLMIEVIKKGGVLLSNGSGEENEAPHLDDDLVFNGYGKEDHHETCFFPATIAGLKGECEDENGNAFFSCKTQGKPYDKVVTACLVVLKNCLPTYVTVDSDGEKEGFLEGLELAKKILKRDLRHPMEEFEDSIISNAVVYITG